MIDRRAFGAGLAALATAGAARAEGPDFEASIREQRTRHRIPGLVAGVADASGVRALAAAGVADLEHPTEPLGPDARLHLGSITKPLTATMIARLVETGRLAWTTTPREVWPDEAPAMHPALAGITLEDLLRHRAGLAAFESEAEIDRAPVVSGDGRVRRAAFARWLLGRAPAFPAGFHYSNAGYALAAAMAEQAADAPWDELMARELFAPLGMGRTGIGWPPPGEARGHAFTGGRFVANPSRGGVRTPAILAPAVDVHASMADLLAFGRAHLTGQALLKPATWTKLHGGGADSYAIGWSVRPFGVFHLGATAEFSGILAVAPALGVTAAAVANAGGWPGQGEMFGEIVSRAFAEFGKSVA